MFFLIFQLQLKCFKLSTLKLATLNILRSAYEQDTHLDI